jgi:Bifunctional DNA primase/polymerase, N-terminal
MYNLLPQHSLDNPLLAAALDYAARGWPVFPCHAMRDGQCTCRKSDCHSPGKHPRFRGSFKHATTDSERIQQWWTKYPDANVAIAMGAASGLIVLDLDPRNYGDLTLDELEAQYSKLPKTVVSFTGGGGAHYFFRYLTEPIRSGKGVLGPGLDIQSDGTYIVAPPSRHASGREYEWEVSSHPDQVPIAALPPWILTRANIPTGQCSLQPQTTTSSTRETPTPQLDLTKESMVVQEIHWKEWSHIDDLAISGQLDREFLAALYKDHEIAWRCLGALGISASRTGEKFLCPIHREEHPSASVYFDRKRGGLTIWCWHERRPYTIPQVRAKQVSGEIHLFRKPSTFLWGLRVLLEAHVVPPAPVHYRPLPASLSVKAPTAVRTVSAGFILLLQCRWLYKPREPVAFSRGFAGRWCGLSEFHAQKAIHWLHDHGYIIKASGYTKPLERHGETPRRTTLYLPVENGIEYRA